MDLWVWNLCSFCWLYRSGICAASVGYKGLQYVQPLMTLRVRNTYVQLLVSLCFGNTCSFCCFYGVWNMCSFCWMYGSPICAASVGSLGLKFRMYSFCWHVWVCNMCSCFRSMGLQYAQHLLTLWVSKYEASVDSMGLQFMFSTSPYYAETYINNLSNVEIRSFTPLRPAKTSVFPRGALLYCIPQRIDTHRGTSV